MGFDLLDSLNNSFGSQVTRQISGFLGDSEASTAAALRTGSATLLAALVQKAAQPAGASEVFRQVTGDAFDTNIGTRLPSTLTSRGGFDELIATGSRMLGSLFGSRLGGLTHAIAEVTGVKPTTATGLLSLAVPMLFGVLKRQASTGGLDAAGLGALLRGQRTALLRSGLDHRITGALGFGSLDEMLVRTGDESRQRQSAAAAATPAAQPAAAMVTRERRNRSWIPWAVGAAIVAAILLAALAGGPPQGSSTATASLPATVHFDSGQASVDASDRRTIVQVVQAVKETRTPLVVTGYTDRTGDEQQNMLLAKDRATAVRDALVAEGIPESQVLLVPPAYVTGTGKADDARRVEISLASTGTEVQR